MVTNIIARISLIVQNTHTEAWGDKTLMILDTPDLNLRPLYIISGSQNNTAKIHNGHLIVKYFSFSCNLDSGNCCKLSQNLLSKFE